MNVWYFRTHLSQTQEKKYILTKNQFSKKKSMMLEKKAHYAFEKHLVRGLQITEVKKICHVARVIF